MSLVAAATNITQAATRIDLVIDEPHANRTVAWPITTGVPFPRGQLTSPEQCRLLDDTGADQPLQAKVAATWDANRASIRWLTIDFLAQPGRKYALEFGPDVRPARTATKLTVEQGVKTIVATGALRFAFLPTGTTAIGDIAADLNGDGNFQPDEVVAAGDPLGEHYYLDDAGQRFSSAGDAAGRRIVVETTGPVRVCVRVDGFYTGPKGQRIVEYRTRYHFFAGLPLVKVIDEFRIVGSTKETRFRDIGFSLDIKLATSSRTVTIDASAEEGNQPLSYPWWNITKSVAAFQTTYRHYGNPECYGAVAAADTQGSQILAQSDRVGEWLQVADRRASVTGSLRWMWQQFPKEWEATADRLTLHVWSPRGGDLDFGRAGIERFFGSWGQKYLRDGITAKPPRNPLEKFFNYADVDAIERGAADGLGVNKHHEFYLHFASANDAPLGAEYGSLAAKQPLALASGAWNCGTDVFGPLAARPVERTQPFESTPEQIVDRLFDLSRYAQDAFGDYGWWLFGAGPHYSYHWDAATQRHYADPRRFEYHTYSKETQLWWNYLRSGERKFYDWAVPSENHWVDVAVSHAPTTIECGWLGGVPKPRTLHWRPGEWSIDSPTHYIRHHERAEAWLRGGAQFWASYHRTLETTTLAYFLTGDERYNDVVEYWREYYADLAGKHSRSTDFQPWHREQAWYKPAAEGEPTKSWAAMMRDYAPFWSGSRHQQTLFFNLATLYEHTWDPKIGQAVKEYADAFLDPAHRLGVWRCQDNELPVRADAPVLAHFWSPALWKYARATGDPRMPDILQRYFAACYAADPFRDFEDVGGYSNSYPGYAYYFTRDPKHLTLAAAELQRLLPEAAPLAKPEDLGGRIYNPHTFIRSMAGVPRTLWAVQEAKRQGVAIPPSPLLRPQRTAIALWKQKGQPLVAKLWGYDRDIVVLDHDGTPVKPHWKTQRYASEMQPFDRTMPNYEVYLHEMTLPAEALEGNYLLTPRLELAVLEVQGESKVLVNAERPILLRSGESFHLWMNSSTRVIQIETAQPAAFRVKGIDGRVIKPENNTSPLRYLVANNLLANNDADTDWIIETDSPKPIWFRIAHATISCWVERTSQATLSQYQRPSYHSTFGTIDFSRDPEPAERFIDGRFGKAVHVAPGRELLLPDLTAAAGAAFDPRQGTIEFWIKRLWDGRVTTLKPVVLGAAGMLSPAQLAQLPLGEWAHVAVVWAPYGESGGTMTYVYIDGRDLGNYRSIDWDGYSSSRASAAHPAAKWLADLSFQAPPGTAFLLDDLCISSTARYADLTVNYGPQQTVNPLRFTPSGMPVATTGTTRAMFRFNGDLSDEISTSKAAARFVEK